MQRTVGPGPQVQEVLDVAGWTGQRAGGDTDGVPLEFGGPARDGKHRVRAQVRVRHDPARTDPILTDLELRLHHGNDIGVADAQEASAGSTVASEMNDRSATTRSTGPPIASAVSSRTLVRSSTDHPRIVAQ